MRHPLASSIAIFVLSCSIFAHSSTLYVDANSANPTPPYSDWSTAATNIQDAIDASVDGDQIWVTNGVYQTGGKVMAGTLTNGVALDKAVTVQSVNGPFATTIAGIGATNNTIAVRCAWLTNGAALVGFTLTRGGRRARAVLTRPHWKPAAGLVCVVERADQELRDYFEHGFFSRGRRLSRGFEHLLPQSQLGSGELAGRRGECEHFE